MGAQKSSRVDSPKKRTSRPRARAGGEYKTRKTVPRRGGGRPAGLATPSRGKYSDKLRDTCELERDKRLPYDFHQTRTLKCVKCNTVGLWEPRTGYAERCAGVWLYKGNILDPDSDIRVSCPNWVRPSQPPVPDWLKRKIKTVRDLDANSSSPSILASKTDSSFASVGTSTSPEQLQSDHAYAQSLYAQEVAAYEARHGTPDEARPSGSGTTSVPVATRDTRASASQGMSAIEKAAQLQQEAVEELQEMGNNKLTQSLKATNDVVLTREAMSSPASSPVPSTPTPAGRRPPSAPGPRDTAPSSGPGRSPPSQAAVKAQMPSMQTRCQSSSCISISSTEEAPVVVKQERSESVISLSDDERSDGERGRVSDSTLGSSNKENYAPTATKRVFGLVKVIPFVNFTSTPKKRMRHASQDDSPRPSSPDLFGPDEDDGMPVLADISDVYDISPTVSEQTKEASLHEERYIPATPGADPEPLSAAAKKPSSRDRARSRLPETDDIPRARNRNPGSGPWVPPLESADDRKAPWSTDDEDYDAPVTPEPVITPLSPPNDVAVSNIYAPLVRTVKQLLAEVNALPTDAREKVIKTVARFYEETGTMAGLGHLMPTQLSGSEGIDRQLHAENKAQDEYVLIRLRAQ
ncbi:hypothetical protein BD311DRAFT_657227 [Dichomitus squalens]|uniref:Uncharacterized protein n=1 Tax=Dichomitus squalens TaxID=114155 RepID=A0A4Q9MY26_9APHY|nr:hypothetical protein BD311DRAFT_657227 [Dichomitus squalens]